MLAVIAAAVYGSSRPAGEARFKKTAVVFLAVAVLSSAILFPLEEWVFSGDREEVAAPRVDCPGATIFWLPRTVGPNWSTRTGEAKSWGWTINLLN